MFIAGGQLMCDRAGENKSNVCIFFFFFGIVHSKKEVLNSIMGLGTGKKIQFICQLFCAPY